MTVRQELAGVLRALPDVQVYEYLLPQLPYLPGAVIVRNSHPAQVSFGQGGADPVFGVICCVDVAHESRTIDLDALVAAVVSAIEESDDLTLAVQTIGGDVIQELLSGQQVLTSTLDLYPVLV